MQSMYMFSYQRRGKQQLRSLEQRIEPLNWVAAVKEIELSYCIGEASSFMKYNHYCSLI